MKQKLARKIGFWSNYYGLRFMLLFFMLGIVVVSGFYVFIASPPDSLNVGKDADNRPVIIEHAESQYLDLEYNKSKEKAFCVYGYANRNSFFVDDVEKADMGYQSKTSVSFSCIQPTWDKRVELFTNPDYKILGTIHTHPEPDSSYNHLQSYVDTVTMAWSTPIYQLGGVYDGEEAHFYTTESTNEELELVYK